jgi:hypothetical protein
VVRSSGSGFDSRRYEIIEEVVVLELSPAGFVRITETILKRKCSGSGAETQD